MVKLAGAGHIVSPRAQLVKPVLLMLCGKLDGNLLTNTVTAKRHFAYFLWT